jgi:hypothetical protein
MRLTTRGWVVLYCVLALALIALLIFVDTYVLALGATTAEMESLR